MIFCTIPDVGVIRHALDTTCPFEIDEFDQGVRSVLAVGDRHPRPRRSDGP